MTSDTRARIDAALARGDTAAAAAMAEALVAAGAGGVALLRLAAWGRAAAGDHAGAHAHLAAALRLAPGDPDVLTEIGAVWTAAGNPAEAIRIFDAMIAHGVDHAPTWLERARALARDDRRESYASFVRAAAADPGCAAALSGAAAAAGQLGDWASARDFAQRALAIAAGDASAALTLARCDVEAGADDAARDRLARCLAAPRLAEADRIEMLTLLGDIADRDGAPERAFAHWADAQARYRRLHAARFGDERRGQSALIRHVLADLDAADVAGWRPLPPDPGAGQAGHVFLLGYPRSGTTLVETVLAATPGVAVIEERPTLAEVEPVLGGASGVAALGALDDGQVAGLRAAYWRRVAAAGVDPAGRTLIDMDPLKGVMLPAIARLFPDARVVVMRRDPRDVVLGCFRRHFHPTPAAYAFADLASAAAHYDALMRLTEAAFERLPLAALELRYEDVVADFDGATRRLCAFLGLAWTPALRDFARGAHVDRIATASGAQVRRGLYDGRGGWRRYADALAPVMPVLEPWIARFGYA